MLGDAASSKAAKIMGRRAFQFERNDSAPVGFVGPRLHGARVESFAAAPPNFLLRYKRVASPEYSEESIAASLDNSRTVKRLVRVSAS
jgi:hypothetical protein